MRNSGPSVEFTEHTRERMEPREISETAVRAVLAGDDHNEDGFGDDGEPKYIARGYAEGLSLEVVYVLDENGAFEILWVVTVWDI